jgi:hypothetical protein
VLESYDALALFLHCARRADRRFAFTADDQAAAVRICQLVEGLPLGVELAAAAVGARSCAEIAAEIGRTLDFLSATARNVPDRQRSLRAAFEHSWQLLAPAAQAVFAVLSVFRGGFTAEAAREVAAAAPADLAGLLVLMVRQAHHDGLPKDGSLALMVRQAHHDGLSKGHCCATTAPDATTCTRRSSSTPCPDGSTGSPRRPVEGCRETGGRSGQPGARGGAARLS